MRMIHSAVIASSRRLDAYFQRFLTCYFLGTILGLLAVRVSMASMGDTMGVLAAGVSLAGSSASSALFRSGCFLILITCLISQLSGRAFFLMLLVGGKAFCTAYVFGALFALRDIAGWNWIRFLVHTVLVLPIFYCLVLHVLKPRLHGRGRYWFRYRAAPMLWIIGLWAAAAWLSTALWALF